MSYFWIITMSFSIAPTAVICLFRFRKILKIYRPFIYLTFLSLLNEIISVVTTHFKGSNAINNNLYILFEWILLVWMMMNWIKNKRRRKIYFIAGCLLTLVWIIETLIITDIFQFDNAFEICYSFAIVFMAIDRLNALVILERNSLLKNARFQICCGLIIFFSYNAILEVLFALHFDATDYFDRVIFQALAYINVLCNIIYTIASLCLPTKQRFTLAYL